MTLPKISNHFPDGKISTRHIIEFYDQGDAEKLPDMTRAIVRDNYKDLHIARWMGKSAGWYDEGSLAYVGGLSGAIKNVVEFSLIGKINI